MVYGTYKTVISEKAAFRCFLVLSVQPMEVGSYDAVPLACLPACMRILYICCRDCSVHQKNFEGRVLWKSNISFPVI